MIAGIAAQIAA